jgi:hypothetical protein
MREPYQIHFDALRNAIYHTARRNYYDFLNRLMSLVVVAGGTAAVADLAKDVISNKYFAFVAAIAGLLQLVFDFGGKARTHEFLQRRFYELTADVMSAKSDPERVAQWDATLNRLYAEEPPPMRALDATAYNAAAESMGSDPSKRIEVKWWQSLLRHFYPFNNSPFPYVSGPSPR